MTNDEWGTGRVRISIRHSDFVIPSSLWFRASSFSPIAEEVVP